MLPSSGELQKPHKKAIHQDLIDLISTFWIAFLHPFVKKPMMEEQDVNAHG